VHDFYLQVFIQAGLLPEDARLAAEVRLESTLRQAAGFDVFGVQRLHHTVRRLQAGGINPRPQIRVARQQPLFALLDGDNGLGAVVGSRAMAMCLNKARGQGLALVGVQNSTTLGTMATYAMQALEHQAIGFASTNTELKIGLPPWGGVSPALGNNPFAIAIPAGQDPALVLDMSVIATPPQDDSATETATSSRAPLSSAFTERPVIGDHKGYGLALVLEVLTGVLTGADFGQAHAPERLDAPGTRHNLGHLFGVLSPGLFMPLAQFEARMAQLRAEIKQAQRAPGVTRLLLPGELEHERRTQRLQAGLPVSEETIAALHQFCDTLGIDMPLSA
jgi:LDH2 family malate/lactate/ureidoglycolate dehydrogenase